MTRLASLLRTGWEAVEKKRKKKKKESEGKKIATPIIIIIRRWSRNGGRGERKVYLYIIYASGGD